MRAGEGRKPRRVARPRFACASNAARHSPRKRTSTRGSVHRCAVNGLRVGLDASEREPAEVSVSLRARSSNVTAGAAASAASTLRLSIAAR